MKKQLGRIGPKAHQSGQVSTEIIAIIGGLLIAVGSLSFAAKKQCIKDMTGTLADCDSLPSAVNAAFRRSIDEVTFLINLPF